MPVSSAIGNEDHWRDKSKIRIGPAGKTLKADGFLAFQVNNGLKEWLDLFGRNGAAQRLLDPGQSLGGLFHLARMDQCAPRIRVGAHDKALNRPCAAMSSTVSSASSNSDNANRGGQARCALAKIIRAPPEFLTASRHATWRLRGGIPSDRARQIHRRNSVRPSHARLQQLATACRPAAGLQSPATRPYRSLTGLKPSSPTRAMANGAGSSARSASSFSTLSKNRRRFAKPVLSSVDATSFSRRNENPSSIAPAWLDVKSCESDTQGLGKGFRKDRFSHNCAFRTDLP